MEKDSSSASTFTTADDALVTVPVANDTLVTVPSTVTNVFDATSASIVPMLLAYAKPFLDISRIEVCSRQNFRRWLEHRYSTLDMHKF